MNILQRIPVVSAIALVVLALLAIDAAATVSTAQAQSGTEGVLHGVVEHGGENADFDPTALTATLNVIQGMDSVHEASTEPGEDGSFEFPVDVMSGRVYFVTIEYQGATYTASREATELEEPLELTIYEATHDPEVIAVDTHSIIVTGAVREEGFVEIWERVTLYNDSGMTLVPDMETGDPQMLSFLRFALPSNYYNLDVRSTLGGGQVLEVDQGFALDTHIPPTGDSPHQFEFVYRLDYDEPTIDLSRTMRFGADLLHAVVPQSVATPSSNVLADLGAADQNGQTLRLLEGSLEPGQHLHLTVSDLPMPPLLSRMGAIAGEWYLRGGAPALMALVVLGLFVVAYRQRTAPVRLPASLPLEQQRAILLDRIADLESRYASGDLPLHRYEIEREQIKQALVNLELRRRFDLDNA